MRQHYVEDDRPCWDILADPPELTLADYEEPPIQKFQYHRFERVILRTGHIIYVEEI